MLGLRAAVGRLDDLVASVHNVAAAVREHAQSQRDLVERLDAVLVGQQELSREVRQLKEEAAAAAAVHDEAEAAEEAGGWSRPAAWTGPGR